MQDNGVGRQNFTDEKQARLPYHAPQLISLGQIRDIVQAANMTGNDATCHCGDCAS
jgi:hypothetical protein